MQVPLQITFRNMESSPLAEQWIRAAADKLENLYGRIMGCRVAVEVPHRHRRKGSAYHVRIDLTLPGGEIVVKRQPSIRNRVRQADATKVKKSLEVAAPHKNLRVACAGTPVARKLTRPFPSRASAELSGRKATAFC